MPQQRLPTGPVVCWNGLGRARHSHGGGQQYRPPRQPVGGGRQAKGNLLSRSVLADRDAIGCWLGPSFTQKTM